MIRAILFDFNGTLVDDEGFHFQAMVETLLSSGWTLSEAIYRERYLGLSDRACLAAIYRDRENEEIPTEKLVRWLARKTTAYQKLVDQHGYRAFPGVQETVGRALASGLHLGIVTGALHSEVMNALEAWNLRESFKVVVAADEGLPSKPDPGPYRRGLELLSSTPPLLDRLLHPHEVLAVEDSPIGLQSARSASLRTAAVAHTYPLDHLEAHQTMLRIDELRFNGDQVLV